jgi:hypothetical protein
MTDIPAILLDLKASLGHKPETDFMNIYQGVPLVYKASLERIEGHQAVFKVQSPDSVCLAEEQQTCILDDRMMTGVSARVVSYDILAGTVVLSDFRYIDQGIGERMTVRVQPKEPVEVEIHCDEEKIPGELVDISMNGAGVRTEVSDKYSILLDDKDAQIKLRLLEKALELPGVIQNPTQGVDHLRFAVLFAAEASDTSTVSRYIAQRRAEIRQEIKMRYQQAYELASADWPNH